VTPAGGRVRIGTALQGVLDRGRSLLRDADPLELVIVMSLLLVAMHSPGQLTPVLVGLAVAGLLHRPLARHGGFWLAVAAVRAVGQLPTGWHVIDNHQYLLTYWCLALGVALLLRDPRSVLRVNARLLIGLAFAFATLWKLISPDFTDGSFFTYTLLVDARFDAVTQTLGGAADAASTNAGLVAALTAAGAGPDAVVTLESGPGVVALAEAPPADDDSAVGLNDHRMTTAQFAGR
jgi:hypothetical protein